MLKTLKFGIFGVGLYQVSLPVLNIAKTYNDLFNRSTQITNDDETKTYISNGERLRSLYGSDKGYAMITGSSDGIGRVMALQMAKYGFNLVLVSRTQEKLERVKAECLKLNPSVDVQTVAMDFSKAGITDFKNAFNGFSKEGGDKELRVLINNVGVIDRAKIFDLSPSDI